MKTFDTRYWPWKRSKEVRQRDLEKLHSAMVYILSDATQEERERSGADAGLLKGGLRAKEIARKRGRNFWPRPFIIKLYHRNCHIRTCAYAI